MSDTGSWYLPRINGDGKFPWERKRLKVAFLLALRSLQRGSRSSVVLTVVIIAMCFTNMVFLPGLFNGIGQSITAQIVDYETGNVFVGPKNGEQYVNDLDAVLDLINGMPGVERATPHLSKAATLKYRRPRAGRLGTGHQTR